MDLRCLSDTLLLENTMRLATKERDATLQVLHHLREVERRSLYAKLSYSSLYEYAVKELKYSEGSAQRRISSMRLLKELPELEKKLESGALPLSTLSQAQSFFRHERMIGAMIPVAEKKEILNSLENKSAREVQRELLARSSEPEKLVKEKLRPISATQTEVKFLVEEELLKDIEELKALLSYKMPGATVKEVFGFAVRKTLRALRPKEPEEAQIANKKTELPPTSAALKKNSRYIPVEVKRSVWKRDGGRCSFECRGRRCTARKYLEFDHKVPFAVGGTATVDNIRLSCRAHNQLAAVTSYGAKKISQFVPRMR